MIENPAITNLPNEIVSTSKLVKVLTLRCFNEYNFEITPEQFVILDTVFKNNSIYQRQIGELIGKDRPNVARLIGILEEKNLIVRTKDSNGRQINRIKLTKKGIDTRNEIYPIINNVRNSYLKNIKEEELDLCFNILNKIKTNISQNIKLKT